MPPARAAISNDAASRSTATPAATRSAAHAAGAGNVISGNTATASRARAVERKIIQGNLIGIDAAGTLDLGNTRRRHQPEWRVRHDRRRHHGGARNVISGNNSAGIRITGAAATGNESGELHRPECAGQRRGAEHQRWHHPADQRRQHVGGTAAGAATSFPATASAASPCRPPRTETYPGQRDRPQRGRQPGLWATGDGIDLIGVSSTVIGGTTTAEGNVISGNSAGIQLQTGATGTLIHGNRIGTNPAGTAAIPNSAGINVSPASGNTIGGSLAGASNQISGNTGHGIWINGADNNVVQGNLIGVGANGLGPCRTSSVSS